MLENFNFFDNSCLKKSNACDYPSHQKLKSAQNQPKNARKNLPAQPSTRQTHHIPGGGGGAVPTLSKHHSRKPTHPGRVTQVLSEAMVPVARQHVQHRCVGVRPGLRGRGSILGSSPIYPKHPKKCGFQFFS